MLATQNRIVFLDYLRVVACFMVMAIHSAEPFYLGGEAPNITAIASRWDMFWITLTECLCRVAVPLFVMASSYLLFPVSEASYGMCLLHMFILAPVSARLIPHLSTPLAILATAAVSFAASAVAALVLRRLPVVGKYLC